MKKAYIVYPDGRRVPACMIPFCGFCNGVGHRECPNRIEEVGAHIEWEDESDEA
jgi:hypothetical protein